ncbi:MAG: MraY family glycosyltransferase [Candidatus Berkelbacteria bacterium]
MIIYILSLLASFGISLLLTSQLISFARDNKILARPRKRDVHTKAMPKLGGLAIIFSFLLTAIIFFYFVSPSYNFLPDRNILGAYKLLGIFLAAAIILVTMLYDDLFGMKSWQKFLVQICVGVIAVAFGIGLDKLTNPLGGDFDLNKYYIGLISLHGSIIHFSILSSVLTVLWVVLMMNIINFVDGLDGLAGGLVMIACATIFILATNLDQPPVALICAILFGAVGGFLVFNFNPAKIFMGDTGSMFLGFMLGILPLISGGKLATVFLVMGFPIVDGIYVVVSRMIRRKNPFTTADKTHLHHKFLGAGFSTRATVSVMYLVAVLFAFVAIQSTTSYKIIAMSVLVLLLFFVLYLLRRKAQKLAGKI